MWIEKTPTGYKFRETYEDPLTGKTKKVSVTKPSKSAQAKKAAAEELRLKIEKKLNVQKEIRLFDVIDDYIQSREPFVKASTRNSYTSNRNAVLRYFDEDTYINRITAAQLQAMIDDDAARVSVTHAQELIRFLRAALARAERLEIVYCPAFKRIVVPKTSKTIEDIEKERAKFLEQDELKAVLELLRPISRDVADICEFQARTGLRIGELAALRDEDYDKEKNEVFVNATLNWPRRKGDKATRGTPKNAYSVRHVPLDDIAEGILSRFMNKNQQRRLWSPTRHDLVGETYIFTNSDGGPFDLSYINKTLKKVKFFKPLSTHIFRHTHISLLAEAGVSIKAVMQRVGHNDPRTTLVIYTHASKAMREQAIRALQQIR